MGQPLKENISPTPTPAGDSTTAPAQDIPSYPLVPAGAGADTGAGTTRPKTEEELEADRLYDERMEDEYAKREGGA
ncbi:hypothetical protein IMZ48_37410 [Candidatus Bathyarchaeota archaeon]|nr:hypothetical protein [Candidatus Bathyarchaeota archaeon]